MFNPLKISTKWDLISMGCLPKKAENLQIQ